MGASFRAPLSPTLDPALPVTAGNPDSRIHAPNENMFVEDYINGIKGIALLFQEFATVV